MRYIALLFILVFGKNIHAQTLTITGNVTGLNTTIISGESNISVFGITINSSANVTLGTLIINHSALSSANLNGTYSSGNYRIGTCTTNAYSFASFSNIVSASATINSSDITFSNLNLSLTAGVTKYVFLVVNTNSTFSASFPLKTNFNINSNVTNTFQNSSGASLATNAYGDIRTSVYPNLARCGATGTFWYDIPNATQTEDSRAYTNNNGGFNYTTTKITGDVPGFPVGNTYNTNYINDGNVVNNFLVDQQLDALSDYSYQAAGVTWTTAKSNIAKVKFYNATSPINTSDSLTNHQINGYFHDNFKLQYQLSGSSTWTDATGWTSSPTYPINTSGNNGTAYGKTYVLTGPVLPSNVVGIRVMGQLRTAGSYSWSLGVREVEVFQESIYFFKPAQSTVSNLSNWGINVDGSGTVPTSFTEPTQFYFNSNETLDASIVSSASTNFIIGNGTGPGVTLTMGTNTISNATVDIPLAIGSGSNTLQLAGSTAPIIGILSQGALGSTVEYNGGTQTVGNYNYNNLTITNNGDKSLANNITVNRTLTIQTGTAKLAIGNYTLTLNGTFTGSASNSLKLNGSSNLTIGGSGALGTLYFDQTTPGVSSGTGTISQGTTNRLNNFTINRTSSGSLILGNELQITNVLTPTAGTLTSNGNLVMLSTDATTSSIGNLSNASIIGNVNVQSFFKGGTDLVNRGYRMISLPVKDNLSYPQNLFSVMKNRFIITGLGNTGNNFDMGGTKQPNAVTIMSYNESALPTIPVNSYNHLPSLGTNSTAGLGYYFFFRGDRTNATTTKVNDGLTGYAAGRFANPEDNTATYIGEINNGNISVSITKTNTNATDIYNGYNLVGNPYPSTLDFNQIYSDNSSIIDDFICIMKRDRTGYLTRSAGIMNGTTTTPIPSGTGGSDIRYIQTGQGFFVRVKDAYVTSSGSLQFKESQKATSGTPQRLLSKDIEEGVSLKGLNNNIKSKNNSTVKEAQKRLLIRFNIQDSVNTDEATIVLENGFNKIHNFPDAAYLGGTSTVSCNSITSDGVNCSINFMPPAEQVDSIKIAVNSVSSNSKLKLNFTDIIGKGSKQLKLLDKFLNSNTIISEENATYNFTIDKSVPASFGNNRFVLIFENRDVLPVDFLSFNLKKNLNTIVINWETASEKNINHFVVERSVDGENFKEIGIQKSLGNVYGNRLYKLIDNNPQIGNNYYRIKSVNLNNPADNKYTNVKSINFSLETNNEIKIYPNPVKNVLNISLSDDLSRKVNKKLYIYDNDGKLIRKFESLKTGKITQPLIGLPAGMYFIHLSDSSNISLGMSKFLKE